MSELTTTPWQGDWLLRLESSIKSNGFKDVKGYLDANPGVSYQALAQALGDANIAAMQLYGEHMRRADAAGELRKVSIDCLSRFLAHHVKRGWGRGRHFKFRMASAFGDWKTVVRQFSSFGDTLDESLDAVTEFLKLSDLPEGWVPESADDPFLQAAFQKGWPE